MANNQSLQPQEASSEQTVEMEKKRFQELSKTLADKQEKIAKKEQTFKNQKVETVSVKRKQEKSSVVKKTQYLFFNSEDDFKKALKQKPSEERKWLAVFSQRQFKKNF